MPPRRTALATVVAACALALVAPAAPSMPSVPEPAPVAGDASHPPAPPRSASAAGPGSRYYYASAQSQYVRWARGARAKLSVHAPRQVKRHPDHSLAEIAVRGPDLRDMVEAGWRQDASGTPRLFVYWWKDGRPQCYNGCGWVDRGRGIKPGSALKPGTSIVLKWVFRRAKWWLVVNGERAGFYPRHLWNDSFRRPRLVQVFGEVVTQSLLPCADMGNGRRPWRRSAASIRGVKFVKGPRLKLRKSKTSTLSGYSVRILHSRALRYGGGGLC